MPKTGKRHKFAWHNRFVKVLIETGQVSQASKAIGISLTSAYKHRKKYEQFRKAWDDATYNFEKDAIGQVENALLRRCIEGNMTAIIFYLCNRAPVHWKSVNKTEIIDQSSKNVHIVMQEGKPEIVNRNRVVEMAMAGNGNGSGN